MPLQIVRNDITKMKVDAIVNSTNNHTAGAGGADHAIHEAAGPQLKEACGLLGKIRPGTAKITMGYDLPAKFVIHTVGPVWRGGFLGENRTLVSCYKAALALAEEYHCESIAFPIIASGVYGYPKEKAIKAAQTAISDFLKDRDMMVYLVVYDRKAYQIGSKLFADIEAFIDDKYVDTHRASRGAFPEERMPNAPQSRLSRPFPEERMPGAPQSRKHSGKGLFRKSSSEEKFFGGMSNSGPEPKGFANEAPFEQSVENASFSMPPYEEASSAMPFFEEESSVMPEKSLEDMLKMLDESFSQMLLRKIDESGMKDSECYKKANIDRKLFSKIRNDVNYKPSKQTALAFAIALELPMSETASLLQKAGYALSHSSKFDIIIEYFITKKNYNIFEINEALFAFDQQLLGN